MTLVDRVLRARSHALAAAQQLVTAHPGEFAALELALRELREAERAKERRKADLHSALREPDRYPPRGA